MAASIPSGLRSRSDLTQSRSKLAAAPFGGRLFLYFETAKKKTGSELGILHDVLACLPSQRRRSNGPWTTASKSPNDSTAAARNSIFFLRRCAMSSSAIIFSRDTTALRYTVAVVDCLRVSNTRSAAFLEMNRFAAEGVPDRERIYREMPSTVMSTALGAQPWKGRQAPATRSCAFLMRNVNFRRARFPHAQTLLKQ